MLVLLGAALLQRPEAMLSGVSLPTDRVRASVHPVPPHGRCALGGHELQLGLDLNGNGLLDTRERQQALLICRVALAGPVQAVATTLVQLSALAPDRACPTGGARVRAGADSQGDGLLRDDDATTDRRWCIQAFARAAASRELTVPLAAHPPGSADDGQPVLIRLSAALDSGLCAGEGGTAEIGLDANRNSRLDNDEILATQHLCEPADPMSADDDGIAALPPSARIGQVVQFHPPGARPWRIAQGPGQRINTEALAGAWGGNWAPTGPKAAWQALAQSADGRQLMAAADGVLLRSTDSGHTWLPAGPTQKLRWTGLAASADGRHWVAASASDAIYTSADGGHSWQRRSVGVGWGLVAASADGQRLLATRHGSQLLVSDDGGQRWTRRAPRADWVSLASSADGQVLAAVASPGRLHVSRDGGDSWHVKGPVQRYSAVAITGSTRHPRIVTAARDGSEPLRWTDDLGDTWVTPELAALRESRFEALAVSAQGQALLAAADDGWLWTSIDSGLTWRRERSGQRMAALGVSAEGLARVALPRGERIHRAAAATTPGLGGALNVRSEKPVSLQYLGTGIWSVVGFSGTFYVQ
jgi:photosystem II stability/assembly factor-like uncharacterized protein